MSQLVSNQNNPKDAVDVMKELENRSPSLKLMSCFSGIFVHKNGAHYFESLSEFNRGLQAGKVHKKPLEWRVSKGGFEAKFAEPTTVELVHKVINENYPDGKPMLDITASLDGKVFKITAELKEFQKRLFGCIEQYDAKMVGPTPDSQRIKTPDSQ